MKFCCCLSEFPRGKWVSSKTQWTFPYLLGWTAIWKGTELVSYLRTENKNMKFLRSQVQTYLNTSGWLELYELAIWEENSPDKLLPFCYPLHSREISIVKYCATHLRTFFRTKPLFWLSRNLLYIRGIQDGPNIVKSCGLSSEIDHFCLHGRVSLHPGFYRKELSCFATKKTCECCLHWDTKRIGWCFTFINRTNIDSRGIKDRSGLNLLTSCLTFYFMEYTRRRIHFRVIPSG